ncbi:zinc ABC transporter substrate-binding protein [Paenalkalicoccus suaedae]|uniref:Zinc ABC transporter substrate-binding protein n=1 Tax=Paenalkalicoccus suaedae TaxID=2592382 RepID=A0A859FD84_9BACI|nr:zinc ABC transporter substrate-binding protein [Paenalkalicoccus suaedae]QKS70808.1 zinc ABC transporter substrate-binding protein [Paenalkalicoccus suaedae]
MKRTALFLAGSALFISACSNEDASNEREGIYVTTSFSVIGDFVEQVLGEHGTVDYLVPIGEEPHEYEPVPSDFRNVSDSEVFYTNGLGLEEWLNRVVDNASETDIVELSEGVTEIPIEGEGAPDPHAWLSPKNVSYYLTNIVADLSERYPEHAEDFEANAANYQEQIDELILEMEESFEGIEEEKRLIVVSENAFKYFGEDFGFETDGIWELNSSEEGTTGQINRVIDVINEREIPAVFVETTVDQRFMETISSNTNVPIAGEVYTDAVGLEGSGAETYLDMIRHNATVFSEGLTEQ